MSWWKCSILRVKIDMSEVLKIFLRMMVVLSVLSFIFGVCYSIKLFKESKFFTVNTVQINGVVNANIKKIMPQTKDFKGKHIFQIDSGLEGVLDDPWIKKASIKKIYPDKLEIDIYERKTVMKIKSKNNCYFYSIEGDLIGTDCGNVKVYDNTNLNNDKLFVVAEIVKYLNYRFTSIVINNSHFVINRDDHQILVSYDMDEFKKSLRYAEGLATLYKKINYIDLRVPGKIFINGVKNEA
ncbi:MAG: cell division protein FtsQ/DivIB [Calditerrivibrio sp.]